MRRLAIAVCVFASLGASAVLAQTQIQPPITPLPPPPGAGAGPGAPLQIQPPTLSADLRIVWEVKNRFRLFRREADFAKHVAAQSIKSVLAAEQIMAAGDRRSRLGAQHARQFVHRPDGRGR